MRLRTPSAPCCAAISLNARDPPRVDPSCHAAIVARYRFAKLFPHGRDMTTLQSATDTLFDHYAQAAGASRGLFDDPLGTSISRSDLEALVTNPDPDIPQELRDAAQFLLDSGA